VDSCAPFSGCVYTTQNCGDCNACTDDSCESSVVCINTPISCDDDVCANDDCNALVGCLNAEQIPVILKLVVFM